MKRIYKEEARECAKRLDRLAWWIKGYNAAAGAEQVPDLDEKILEALCVACGVLRDETEVA